MILFPNKSRALIIFLRSPFCCIASVVCISFLLNGCATTGSSPSPRSMTAAELNANPPEYWIGQRVYEPNHMTWGWVKRPQEDWSKARLILLKEDTCLAPHRTLGKRDADHNYQYKLYGHYWEKKGYEPVINRLLDVFNLTRYESLGPAPPLKLKPVAKASASPRRSRAAARSAGPVPSPNERRNNYEQIE